MRFVVRGLGILLVFVAGCGQPRSETLIKTRIDLLNAQAAEYERFLKNPNAVNPAEIKTRLAKIDDDMLENQRALDLLPRTEVTNAEAKFRTEANDARERARNAQKELLKLVIKRKTP